jgi:zinc transport system substrate-binding protein
MRPLTSLSLMILTATLALGPAAQAETAKDGHDHHHMSEAEKQIHAGYFEDSQIQPRSLEDWAGDWQSVYSLLQDGTLDPVMQAKAQTGDKSAEDYKAYYETGYRTEVDRIVIQGDSVSFHSGDAVVSGTYAQDGHEVLTYEKGNRGVRFIFRKTGGDEAAPAVIQFSDHAIAPQDARHFHLYWGNDRAKVLAELTNWPTYYPAGFSGGDVLHEMLAH